MKKILNKSLIKSLLKIRDGKASKIDFGHAILLAGNEGKMGASMIASRACLRSGVGLLTVCIPKEERLILQTAVPEAMLCFHDQKNVDWKNFSAIGMGPGIGINSNSTKLLKQIFKLKNIPMVIDADALNSIAKHRKLLELIPLNSILTPHAREFDRLFGEHKNHEARIKTAIRKAQELHVIIVLKSSKTIVTYGGNSFENASGNVGLAKGGSGDALTGILTSLLAQGYLPEDAARVGVFIHGLAADITLNSQSEESMLITDVIDNLGNAFKAIRS